jgi:predicted ATPase
MMSQTTSPNGTTSQGLAMTPNPALPVVPTLGSVATSSYSAGSRLLQGITLRNFLSFGPDTPSLTLGNLNVLVGPNASGKSNLLEAIALLRRAPNDLRPVILRGGGVGEWIWKGRPHESASVNVVVSNPSGSQPLRHVLAFEAVNQSFRIADERIENELPANGESDPYFYYLFQGGQPIINVGGKARRQLSRDTSSPELLSTKERWLENVSYSQLSRDKIDSELSILAQRRDPDIYPEKTHLAET